MALFIFSSNLGRRGSWGPVEQIAVEMTAPAQSLLTKTIRYVEGWWLQYFYLVDLRKENTRMRAEVETLRMENHRYLELMATQSRLRELLQFKNTMDWPVVAAQVIGRDPTGWFESVIIDKGKSSGLKVNMPVVNAGGVVGQVVSVSPSMLASSSIVESRLKV